MSDSAQATNKGKESGRWISVEERLPPSETPVLILLSGVIRIGERQWDVPGFEDSYQKFWYWDDPADDGQCWEVPDVTHWMPLPAPPASIPSSQAGDQMNGTKP